jgi:methylmalonyl-CoA mutase
MQEKLLAEFPEVSYETWRARVDKDLKGADFDKRLVTRTLDGLEIRPLFVERDLSPDAKAAAFAGLAPYRRGGNALGMHGARWDVRALQESPDLAQLRADIAADLQRGATSLWLRFDDNARSGRDSDARALAEHARGIACSTADQLDEALRDVDLAKTAVMLDAGGNAPAVAALLLAVAKKRGLAPSALRGSVGCDPLGALAKDGALHVSLEGATAAAVDAARWLDAQGSGLRALDVSTSAYHDAGASAVQEVGYALATGVTYLRWLTEAGLRVDAAAARIGFTFSIGNEIFVEVAKQRAFRVCWAKVVAASGGNETAQNTVVHTVTSGRTKTRRDPWVNMLRSTTEAFSAMVGGADSLTTLGFDEVVGPSDAFSRRIARNVQVVLNEEAHVTHVADPGGGSYFVESLTDQVAQGAWLVLADVEAQGGMPKALLSGVVAKQISDVADKRAAAIRKRSAPILGVSEFANLGEEAIVRGTPRNTALQSAQAQAVAKARAASPQEPLAAKVKAARDQGASLIASAVDAAVGGATLGTISCALASPGEPASMTALPVRRNADAFEALRTRADAHGSRPTVFLANLGAIPQHKARSTFSTGFLNAGGLAVLDNDGFATPEDAAAAFAKSGAKVVVLCGSDEQYPDWVPKLAPLLRAQGAIEVLLAGRPGDHEAAFKAAGVGSFLFLGADVASMLSALLDRMGVKP